MDYPKSNNLNYSIITNFIGDGVVAADVRSTNLKHFTIKDFRESS